MGRKKKRGFKSVSNLQLLVSSCPSQLTSKVTAFTIQQMAHESTVKTGFYIRQYLDEEIFHGRCKNA